MLERRSQLQSEAKIISKIIFRASFTLVHKRVKLCLSNMLLRIGCASVDGNKILIGDLKTTINKKEFLFNRI